MAMFVKFWGTRGLIPTPGNATRVYGCNTPCVEVRSEEALIVCDAGSGIREFAKDLLTRGPQQKQIHVLISHNHWDHIQGFPFAPVYLRGKKVLVHGQGSKDGTLQKLLSGEGSPEHFPGATRKLGTDIEFVELGGDGLGIEGVGAHHFRLNHPGGCHGFVFEQGGKKVVCAPDNELELQPGDKFPDPAHEGALRGMPRALVEAVRDADLLILDGQYDDEQYAIKKSWGHSSCFSAVDLAIRAGVKNLALFHHDPESTDHDLDMRVQACYGWAEKHKTNLTIFAAREGMELKY
jgi:phosphoribosyl 1,2-cyclic phosphodiesterase